MAYLDNERVVDLVADIKALADTTYLTKKALLVETDDEDIDTYLDPGIWYFSSLHSPIHKPSGGASFGFLIVLRSNELHQLAQIWVDNGHTMHAIYFRANTYTPVNWTSWKKLITDVNIAPVKKTITIASSFPSGVTDVPTVDVVQSGHVVTVQLSVTRDSTAITSYQAIASGLPQPFNIATSGNITIPFATIPAANSTFGRGLDVIVSSSGNLAIRRGEIAAQYLGSFTYLTNEL